MESREYRHIRYLEKLEKHKEDAKSAMKYSSDRFDILIISLSSTSLILSISFIDRIINNASLDVLCLKLSWIAFAFSIISNLLSQVTGYITNNHEVEISTNLIRMERDKKMKGNLDKLCEMANILNDTTISLNILSLIALILGIISIINFLIINF